MRGQWYRPIRPIPSLPPLGSISVSRGKQGGTTQLKRQDWAGLGLPWERRHSDTMGESPPIPVVAGADLHGQWDAWKSPAWTA
ncbi:hypothetical protein Tdes44962_MAKER02262 [Teratosphaeria destructans]|uniref:Uncharacterized protein n=1 Tax=Teratosphaeria destructans TaxID=418781 RepID=A0A9W7SUD1_9PEZI|nr:hypothetical protein Tdes44962_MAKER02262 [Teratosphaeria destructans]